VILKNQNRNYPELSEANFRAEQLVKNIHSVVLFRDEKIFTVITPKNSQNDRLYAHPSTKKKDVVTKRLRTRLTLVTDDISRRDISG